MTTVGSNPTLVLTGSLQATRRALDQAGLRLADIDLFEVNEAFAAVPVMWMREFGITAERVNVCGGAIGLGHPLGASGARLMVTLLHELERRGARYGLQTMCCAGGLGTATIIERVPCFGADDLIRMVGGLSKMYQGKVAFITFVDPSSQSLLLPRLSIRLHLDTSRYGAPRVSRRPNRLEFHVCQNVGNARQRVPKLVVTPTNLPQLPRRPRDAGLLQSFGKDRADDSTGNCMRLVDAIGSLAEWNFSSGSANTRWMERLSVQASPPGKSALFQALPRFTPRR